MAQAPGPTPTPYADVNALLDTLLARVRATVGEQFVAMFLDGSLRMEGVGPRPSRAACARGLPILRRPVDVSGALHASTRHNRVEASSSPLGAGEAGARLGAAG